MSGSNREQAVEFAFGAFEEIVLDEKLSQHNAKGRISRFELDGGLQFGFSIKALIFVNRKQLSVIGIITQRLGRQMDGAQNVGQRLLVIFFHQKIKAVFENIRSFGQRLLFDFRFIAFFGAQPFKLLKKPSQFEIVGFARFFIAQRFVGVRDFGKRVLDTTLRFGVRLLMKKVGVKALCETEISLFNVGGGGFVRNIQNFVVRLGILDLREIFFER